MKDLEDWGLKILLSFLAFPLLHCYIALYSELEEAELYVCMCFDKRGKRRVMSRIRINAEMRWRRKTKFLKFYFRVLGPEIN